MESSARTAVMQAAAKMQRAVGAPPGKDGGDAARLISGNLECHPGLGQWIEDQGTGVEEGTDSDTRRLVLGAGQAVKLTMEGPNAVGCGSGTLKCDWTPKGATNVQRWHSVGRGRYEGCKGSAQRTITAMGGPATALVVATKIELVQE